jgi:hypothetical protein
MQKIQPLYCWEGMFAELLPINGPPIVARVRFRGNVFTESLPSNGSIRHNNIGRYIGPMKYSGYWQLPKVTHTNLVGPIRFVFKAVAKWFGDAMPRSSILRSWLFRQYVPPQRRWNSTGRNGITSHKNLKSNTLYSSRASFFRVPALSIVCIREWRNATQGRISSSEFYCVW